MSRIIYAGMIGLCLLAVLGVSACSASPPVTIQTGEPEVTAGIRFEGAALPFWGQVPEGCQVVVKATGPPVDYPVRPRNGSGFVLFPDRVCGLPSLYQVLSSTPWHNIKDEAAGEIGIDDEYAELREKATVHEANVPDDDEESTRGAGGYRIKQAVQQMVADHKYGHFEDAIEVDGDTYSGTLYIPAGGPLREVRLHVYAIRDGGIVGTANQSVNIPRKYFTRPFGATREEREIYLAIMLLAAAVCTMTVFEWLHKGKAGHAEQK
ncbi:MAG: TIGR02186 family protein [Bacillota bacterium]|uniref:TIGR02186 family protein n=1 Tax=Desulforudis sp. DRI-14 TaxID=3459793 RepID=UPI003476EE88